MLKSPMSFLRLKLFGRPEVWLDGKPVTGLNNKALAILFYVATSRQTHSREALAGLLWSDFTEQRARGNLRVELGKLRPYFPHHLNIQRNSIAFDFDSKYDIDIVTFEDCLNRPQPTAEQMETAVKQYQGDFLTDFTLKGAPLFEEWQLIQQERLRQAALSSLNRLVNGYAEQKMYDGAIMAVRQLIAIEPWLESSHQELMRLLTLNGQKLTALSQYDSLAQILEEELGAEPSPETKILYQQILNNDLESDPDANALRIEAKPTQPVPFQPLPLSSHFVGRELEIESLSQTLTQPNGPHLMALVGMGGIGKTTLANQLSHALRNHFADGVLWADAAASEPLDILYSWGQAFGFDFSGLSGVKNRAAAVRGMLADKQVLIVLDDVFDVSRIRPLLPNGPSCAILLTTRDLDAAIALDATVLQIEELTVENGRQLLINILGEERVNSELKAADEIGQLLEYHPLAMEICAQRLKSRRRRRLVDMATQLREVQNRLDLEMSDRVVKTSFEVSWQALDANHKKVFTQLAVFKIRPFPPHAASAVIEKNLYQTEDLLFTLNALSLLREAGETHFRFHALLAGFALEKLGNGLFEVNGRMAKYYQTFAEAHQEEYDALIPEWGNLLASMQVAHQQENWEQVLAYGQALLEPWFAQARYVDIQAGMVWVKEAASALKDEPTLAYFEMKLGQVLIERSEYDTAVVHLEQSLTRFEVLDNQARIGEIKFNLARVAKEQGNYETALDLLMESKKIRQHLGDERGLAAIMYREARLWTVFGPDMRKAEELALNAAEIQKALQDNYWQLNS
ncbi:MAG: BTAD domain-containing putative transcriptional regulator, partial [Chloroflexota bacterium]